ncbi:MAG: hypothetical protein GYB36_02200 [Alphaproteobacteria bacterium]|nr:hypothetical protein [Alphaproteobacteria bacterium]
MDEQHRPGVVRFLIYMITAAGLAGGLAGWINASGDLAWSQSLAGPSWSMQSDINVISGMFMLQLIAISLWLSQSSGRDGYRTLCTFAILGILAALFLQLLAFFGARDLEIAFLAHFGTGIYMIFVSWLVGRCSKAAGYLLWPPLVWQVYHIALMFELMRLNGDDSLARLAGL